MSPEPDAFKRTRDEILRHPTATKWMSDPVEFLRVCRHKLIVEKHSPVRVVEDLFDILVELSNEGDVA